MTPNEFRELVYNAKSLPELLAQLKALKCEKAVYNMALRSFLSDRARDRGVPVFGTFELTPFCNLDCKMCYVRLKAGQMQGQKLLQTEDWERIMSEAIDAGMMYATFTGGECLTHSDFDRLYLFLHSRGIRISVMTNGVLLDKERVEFFAAHPPGNIQITLYGADEDSYDRVTGHRLFHKVEENIRNAKQRNLPLSLAITPNAYLGSDTERLIRFAAELGIYFSINAGLIEPRESTGRSIADKDLTPDEYMKLFRLQMQLQGKCLPAECEDMLPEKSVNSSGEIRGLRCGGGRSAFKISWDGKMVPCNSLYYLYSEPLKSGFVQAWKCVRSYAEEVLLPIECEDCAYRAASHRCAALHQATPGHADPAQCAWCKAMVRAGLAKLV